LEANVVVSREILLFYVPPPAGSVVAGGKVAGTLCWCPRGDRHQDPANSLALKYLKTVLLKKNTATFQHPSLQDVNKHRCFSLVASLPENGENKVAELNIELDSQEQVSAWLFGVYSLVTKGGMDAVLDEPSKVGSGRGKRFSIVAPKSTSTLAPVAEAPGPTPNDATSVASPATLKNVLSSGSTEDAVHIMETGTEFQSYENGAAGVNIRTILLFYAADETKLGSIYWCVSGTKKVRSAHRSIPLHEITDICPYPHTASHCALRVCVDVDVSHKLVLFLSVRPLLSRVLSLVSADTGKQTRTFTAPESSSAVEELCWSIIGKHDMLNLEASTKPDMTTWLFGVNKLIVRSGKKMVLEEGAAPSKVGKENKMGKRRFSVKPGAGAQLAPPPTKPDSAATAGQLLAMADCPLLYEGHVFTCYIEKGGVIVRSKQFVFYSNEGGGARICWCAPGFRVESELNQIKLKSLTDVYGQESARGDMRAAHRNENESNDDPRT
jgi:hypothetical protein